MSVILPVRQNFTGGEVSPRMSARFDMRKYHNGCKTLRNMYVLPHGPAMKRPGLRYIASTKTSSKVSRVVAFEFSETQAYILEFGDQYLRFYMDGGQIESAGSPYEISTPYTESDLADLKFCQSADTLFIVHPDYSPRILTRTGHTSWTLSNPSWINRPYIYNYNGYTITPSGTTGSITLTASSGMFLAGHVGSIFKINGGRVTVTAYTSATVVTATVTITLSGTTADSDWEEIQWSDLRGYPQCVNFFEQRLCFASTYYEPQTIWMSKSGDYYDHSVSSPIEPTDACEYEIASEQVNVIKWLSPSDILAVGTNGAEWALYSGSVSDVVTPTSVKCIRQSTRGSNGIQPVMIGGVHVFCQRSGKTVRELRYSEEMDKFDAIDLSIVSEHLTRSKKIVDWAYQQIPNSILWCVLDNGSFLGLTYLREHEVVAWHPHQTDGEVESVAVIPGDDGDEVWMVVKRTIDGSTVRYIERMDPEFAPSDTDPTDGFFVDCGLSYDGAAATVISGLAHLEGEEVAILGDGSILPRETVSSGQITIDVACSKVHVGLPFTAKIEPNPIEIASDEVSTMGSQKSVIAGNVSIMDSGIFSIGTDFTNMEPHVFRTTADNLGEYVPLFTGVVRETLDGNYDNEATICVESSAPLPLTVRGITYEVEVSR